jgi:hypothetical protein
MEITPIHNSSMFSHAGYDEATGELHVTFHQGGQTHAYPVTPQQYAEFQAAPSAGKWFHANIRGKIEGRKVQHAEAV